MSPSSTNNNKDSNKIKSISNELQNVFKQLSS